MTADDPLDAVIAAYLQQVEAGQVPDREALLARFPELADRLRAFFADCDRLDRRAGELRLSADPGRTADDSAPGGTPPRVRYFGDYELLEVVAQGGMGVVYKARQVSLNRIVALKMILAGHLANAEQVRRFRAEAEEAANLDHPHIVPIYEVGEHDGQQYYAMRFVEGTSLADHPRADARREARLVATVARAVHHAHQRGILHRDLKPSNVLVDPSGTPQVADFGLAKRLTGGGRTVGDLTGSGALVGTPRYMAPEQAAGRKDLTVAADVYGLGVVLYERLTGRTPFQGESVLEVLRQVREAEPPRPSALVPGLGRDLETVCLRCLEKDPAKRYGSAEELAEELERWLRGEPIRARPVGPAERAWRWCRRNPAVAALLACSIFSLACGTAASTLFAVSEARTAADERRERQRAESAEDELERALARAIVRPLQDTASNDTLSKAEASALCELAEKPGKRLWMRFLEEGAGTRLTAGQLRGRAEPALIAAVGLDAARRRRAEERLSELLGSADLGLAHKFDLVEVCLSLGDLSPATSRRAIDVLFGVCTSPEYFGMDRLQAANRLAELTLLGDPETAVRVLSAVLQKETVLGSRGELGHALALAAERLPPTEAARVLLTTSEIPGGLTPGDIFAISAPNLAAVAGRMEPPDGVRLLQAALGKAKAGWGREPLAKGLSGVAGRMPPAEGARLLQTALENEPKTSSSLSPRQALCMGLAAVAGRMEAPEAARVLTAALEKEEEPQARRALALGLASVGGRMQPREAATVCEPAARAFVTSLAKETDALARQDLASALATVAGGMEPGEAARVCGRASDILAAALAKETRPGMPRWALVGGINDLAGRLRASDSAHLLLETLGKVNDVYCRQALAEKLAATAERIDPREAAHLCEQAASVLAGALVSVDGDASGEQLAFGLAAVARRMEPAAAARALNRAAYGPLHDKAGQALASGLVAAAGRMTPPEAVRVLREALAEALPGKTSAILAGGLAEAAGRMDPRDASRILAEVFKEHTDDAFSTDLPEWARLPLADGLAAAAARMDRAAGAAVCRPALEGLSRSVTVEPVRADRFASAQRAVQLLAVTDERGASDLARKMALWLFADAGANRTEEEGAFSNVQSLDALVTDTGPSELTRRAGAVAAAAGLSAAGPLAPLPSLPGATGPLPCRLDTRDLVELLKYPTCFGPARKVVLKHLGNRYGRTFADHWEFVRYAEEHHLGLDFTTPPKHPARP